jgi:hypothetical protein
MVVWPLIETNGPAGLSALNIPQQRPAHRVARLCYDRLIPTKPPAPSEPADYRRWKATLAMLERQGSGLETMFR